MARPRVVDQRVVEHAKGLAARAQTIEDLRCAQAVLLPALLSATLEQTAAALGVGRASVGRYQAKVRSRLTHPAQLDAQWGGRRRAAMSQEEEREFLEPWAEQSADGGMLIVAPLRAALAQHLGRPVTHSVVYRLLARHGWRKVAPDTRHPKSDPSVQEEWKKLPEMLAACLEPVELGTRRVRLMFQDEARFGRMVRIRRCWAQKPERPVVCNGYEREFLYVYGAVSPLQGQLDWMITPQMNTQYMSQFLAQVSVKHRRDFIIMVVDGASSHVAKDLIVPKNIRLLRLPPYAPELNPQEHVWDELREKEFPNRVFDSMDRVREQLEAGLPRLAADRNTLRSLTAWPWINSLILNAH